MRFSLLSKVTPRLLKIATLALAAATAPGLFDARAQTTAPGSPDIGGVTILTVGEASLPLISFSAPTMEGEVAARRAMGAPKIGEATAVFNISQAGGLLAWVETVWNKQCVEKDTTVRLADQDYNIKRGIDMGACVITGIEWPELKASDGKKHFEVTAKFQPQTIKFIAGEGRATPPAPAPADQILPENFTVTMAGIADEHIVSITLPRITAKIAKESLGRAANRRAPSYKSVEYGTIKIEIGAAGQKSAEDLAIRILQDGNCEEGEFMDILIDMKDQSLKKVLGTFTLIGCGLKKFDWTPKLEGGKEGLATCTLEFMVEDFRFAVAHK